jgi:molybdate transport system substrate-binding protein
MLEPRTTTRGQTPALSGDFERATGHNLSIMYDTAGPVKNRILAGEPADVAIVLRSLLNDLSQAGKIANGSIIDLARSPVVLTVRAGAPKP